MRDSSPETNTGPYLVCEKFEFGIFHCPCSSLGVSDGRAISDEYRTQTVRFRSYLLPVLLTLLNWSICKLYGTSTDYLLGLTDIDPSDEARKQRQRLTEEEQNEMHRYEEYLLWKRKK